MRRRIRLVIALVVVSLIVIAVIGIGRDAFASYFDLQPHGCGGG